MDSSVRRIDGEVRTPGDFGFAAMTALPDQIADVATLMPGVMG